MSKRDILLLLEDMLESAGKIKRYTASMTHDSFMNDEKTKDAVVRNFEIIGEAANRIALDFQTNNPELEWKRIRGFRNRIVHEYFGIDYEIVWEIIESNLDELIEWLEVLINKNEPNQ
jgi:uncharacterized protein with HEPN domain